MAGSVLEAVGPSPDVALLFICGHAPDAVADIAEATGAILSPGVLAGATAVGVIGGAVEIEDAPAVALWSGRTGRAEAVHLEAVSSPDGTAVVGMPDEAAVGRRTLVLLSDPYTFPTDALAQAANNPVPRSARDRWARVGAGTGRQPARARRPRARPGRGRDPAPRRDR